MQKITIAVDGYSSCGKSTLAKALAQKLGYNYIDTGAMYRAVALFALNNNYFDAKGKPNIDSVINSLPNINVSFTFNAANKTSETCLNGINVEREIRSMRVSDKVSLISSIKEVREKMVALQREMGKNKGVVLDGRDIGTNVFPDAELKLFMTADTLVRAQRRFDELSSKGQYHSIEEIKLNLQKRDYDDTHRKENPLTRAKNAVVIDNSDLSREQQLEFVLKLINDLHLITLTE
ncbi:MAG: (d)CMP kinase [Bacteroidetes bacterium]|nr:(d)CMP kinase [Bacteroidota bacterium]